MTATVTYTLFDPTGNMTLLAETPVPEASQPLLAKKLMALEPWTEQVGFVSPAGDGIRLRMAGGEFCGNASMSAAVLYAAGRDMDRGTVTVRVSGPPEPVQVEAEKLSDRTWRGTVAMPKPLSVGRERFPEGKDLPVVHFPGIAHVILEEEIGQREAERLAPLWCGCLNADARGLMFLDREKGTLKPLVYVPEAETLFWESSCASGTTAAGAYLAKEAGEKVCFSLAQPGGTLTVTAEPDGRLQLAGTVRIVYRRVGVTV